MKALYFFFAAVALSFSANAQDQKFLDFQSAKIAYEKYDDCGEAKKLMEPIYNDFKEDMSFVHLYAKVLTCLNKYKEALTVLQTYNEAAQDPAISEQIAELNYKLRLNDLGGEWTVYSSNDNNLATGGYIFTITQYADRGLTIACPRWRCNATVSLKSEDDDYSYYTGTYYEEFDYTYTTQTVLEALAGSSHEEKSSTSGTWTLNFTYNKKSKTLSYSVPKSKVVDHDVVNTYGNWDVTLKKK